MVKTSGSFDKVLNRKTRADRGKRRKKYAGKPCMHKKPKAYNRRIGNKDSLKFRFLFRVPMSKDGYNNWNKYPWLKNKLYKEVTNMKKSPVMVIRTQDINTKQKLQNFAASNLWVGKFVMMGISNAKTKTHRKWVKVCTIRIKDNGNELRGEIIENKRLSKYSWFYKG